MSVHEAFGKRLCKARKRAGLSQYELAEKLQITQPAVSWWENGRHAPTLEFMIPLAEALGVTVGWLAAGEGEMV